MHGMSPRQWHRRRNSGRCSGSSWCWRWRNGAMRGSPQQRRLVQRVARGRRRRPPTRRRLSCPWSITRGLPQRRRTPRVARPRRHDGHSVVGGDKRAHTTNQHLIPTRDSPIRAARRYLRVALRGFLRAAALISLSENHVRPAINHEFFQEACAEPGNGIARGGRLSRDAVGGYDHAGRDRGCAALRWAVCSCVRCLGGWGALWPRRRRGRARSCCLDVRRRQRSRRRR